MTKCQCGLMVLAWVLLGLGCSEDDCSADGDCSRGQVCLSGSCKSIACETAADCPEGGRTCVYGYGTCGQKECNTGSPEAEQCSDALCDTGSFSCLTPCQADDDCATAGTDSTCQSGVCRPRQRLSGGQDATVIGGPQRDSFLVNDGGADVGFVPVGVACAPCSGSSDCAELGQGAVCEALGDDAYCFGSCAGGQACPQGFSCREGINLCVPINGSCEVCPGKPCAPGLVCDASSGSCIDAPTECERCFGEGTCADDLSCVMVDGRSVCVAQCTDGTCESGKSCEGGYCVPTASRCDPCNGACGGQTPVCIESEGICGECGPEGICGIGQVCNMNTWRCEVPSACGECVVDGDCASCAGRNICLSGECVACLQASDCPARSECDTVNFECISSPCSGVVCQGGTSCNANTGRCETPDGNPGCTSASDCNAGSVEMGCNTQTGQCYYTDGTCDAGPGGNGVCSPGSECTVDFLSSLGGTPKTVCQCNQLVMTLPMVECHPGLTCFQLPIPGLEGPGTCLSL